MRKGTQVTVLSVLLVACIVGGGMYLYFTQEKAPATMGPATTPAGAGNGVPAAAATGDNIYCDGADKTVTLAVQDMANSAAVSAADTYWELSADGVNWYYKETDSNSASPSVTLAPFMYARAQVKDDATYYGVNTPTYHVACTSVTQVVKLKAIDTTPSVTAKTWDNGNTYAAGANDTLTANGTIYPTIRLFTTTNQYYNDPAICFDYATGNFTAQKVMGAQIAAVPYFLKGTVEECYKIPSFGDAPVDVMLEIAAGPTQLSTGSTQLTSTVYLVDTQKYVNDAGQFSEGYNLEDSPYTNVGDSTDSSTVATLYFNGA